MPIRRSSTPALGEDNGLKQELPKLEDEWLELSTQIEEETARELSVKPPPWR